MLLAGDLFISEFMAVNGNTLQASDGEYYDWIEIANPSEETVSLNEWSLTDNDNSLDKWQFPVDAEIGPGGYLVVFASGINESDRTEIHTNFKLSGGGEYLGLVNPDGDVVHEYAPEYPVQETDVSYGVGLEGLELLGSGSSASLLIPTDGSLGSSWTENSFVESVDWSSVDSPIGYGANTDNGFAQPLDGFKVRNVSSSTKTKSLAAADAVLAGADNTSETTLIGVPVINYAQGGDGNFGFNAQFPDGGQGSFVLHATATVFIETAGVYTFGSNNADGARLMLDGEAIIVDDDVHGESDRFSDPITLTVGSYDLDYIMFQSARATVAEIFAAPGSYTQFNDAFKLIGDTNAGGLQVQTTGVGAGMTDIESEMKDVGSSAYTRLSFDIESANDVVELLLSVQYDDGYVAYLNGTEIARANAPDNVAWDSTATAARELSETLSVEEIDITQRAGLLIDGENILAIHGLNVSASDSDFLIAAGLTATGALKLDATQIFATPTPGSVNLVGTASINYSQEGGSFSGLLTLEMTSNVPGGTVRYTLDGSLPTANALVSVGPISIVNTTQVRAAVFDSSGVRLSPLSSNTYTLLGNDLVNFSSNLPILVLDNFGKGSLPADWFQDSVMTLFVPDEDTGRTVLTDTPAVQTRAGIATRGSSSGGWPKHQMKLELWDEAGDVITGNNQFDREGQDQAYSLLGMPRESDWVLSSPYTFDRNYLRNSFVYGMANKIGWYAPRTRFIEIFMDRDGEQLDMGDYFGIYILMEKIKAGPDRVNIDELTILKDDAGNPIRDENGKIQATGGFIIKEDRADPGEPQFSVSTFDDEANTTRRVGSLNYVEPKEIDLRSAEFDGPAKREFIQDTLDNVMDKLYDIDWRDEELGYAPVIDEDSWIDFSIINLVPMNVDAYRLSGYFYVNNDQEMVFGPAWDCDRCLESTDGRDDNPLRWTGNDSPVFGASNYIWLQRFYQDPAMQEKFKARWRELRETVLKTDNVMAFIDGMADEVREASDRNRARWGGAVAWRTGSNGLDGTYQGEVNNMKNWLTQRLDWIDANLEDIPVLDYDAPEGPGFSQDGGKIEPGFELVMTSPGRSKVIYTIDGSDPRTPTGQKSENAITGKTVVLDGSTFIRARILNGPDWGTITEALFTIDEIATADNLKITEINYNPAAATTAELAQLGLTPEESDRGLFEFIELQNVSDEKIELAGSRFTEGVSFLFSSGDVTTLDAGQRVVVVKDRAAFEARYGTDVNVIGEFAASTSLNNGGENLRLRAANGEDIAQFAYDDSGAWPDRADGRGAALEIKDSNGDPSDGNNWRSSTEYGGTPGAAPMGPLTDVVINEVLTNSDGGLLDQIELFNTSGAAVDIGGWYLSDSGSTLKKYKIPAGTTIDAGGYLVFDEDDFNSGADGFLLNSNRGDDVWLMTSDDNDQLVRFVDHVEVPSSESNVSFGRVPNAIGDLVPTTSMTFGATNSGAKIGDVIISEIMYNPTDVDGEEPTGLEYVELYNTTSSPIDLTGWRLRKGIDIDFDEGTTIGPLSTLVVISFNPDNPEKPENADRLVTFRDTYGIDESVVIVGGYSGRLENRGEAIQLKMPQAAPANDLSFTPHTVVDHVRYDNTPAWPQGANDGGQALHRTEIDDFGSLPSSWVGAAPSPGAITFAPPVDDGPEVTGVKVASTSASNGPLVGGHTIPGGPDQLSPLPWTSVDQISLTFSADVTIAQNDLSIFGVNVASYATSDFAYDAASHTATWTLPEPFGPDKILIALSQDVVDGLGNPIDGGFEFRFNVLPGDSDRDGSVDIRDLQEMRAALLSSVGDPDFNAAADLDGDGDVDIRDVQTLRVANLTELPIGDPGAGLLALLADDDLGEGESDEDAGEAWNDAVDSALSDGLL